MYVQLYTVFPGAWSCIYIDVPPPSHTCCNHTVSVTLSNMSVNPQDLGDKLHNLKLNEDGTPSRKIIKTTKQVIDPVTKEKTVQSSTEEVISHNRYANYAFAFDIDGVLLKGSDVIPQAPEAMRMLNGDNEYNIRVPYIFVTNGSGLTEEVRCKNLSKLLETEVNPGQFIQGSTPMRSLVEKYDTVLVVGGVGEACRKVAQEYGFKNVVTPGDILKWNPNVSPFRKLNEEEYAASRTLDFTKIAIGAILVFADSREWASDQQIILELLMSKNGVMGTESKQFNEGPDIYFAHDDFVWSTNYNLSRYGMGALQVCISALYQAHTGKELNVTKFGKPNKETFNFANSILKSWRQDAYEAHFCGDKECDDDSHKEGGEGGGAESTEPVAESAKSAESTADKTLLEASDDKNTVVAKAKETTNSDGSTTEVFDLLPAAQTVYFVGDTPESDIRFANTFDKTWFSILVKTGVYQDGTEPAYKPKKIVDNVLEAVKFAIHREHEKELELREQARSAVASGSATPGKGGSKTPVESLHPHELQQLVMTSTTQ